MATVANLLTDIAAINAAGRTALADKGVIVAQDATTADIISAIDDIPAGGGGTEYSSIEYDEATNTYTLAEKDDPTITHTLTCTYDAQGRISGMVYDDKNIAVTYNNDGTVTVGGTVVDVSEYPEASGTELNIAFNSTTAPEDTTKLWVKTAEPTNVTVDYDIDNGIESIATLSATLTSPSSSIGCGVVGTKCYLFCVGGTAINVFDTVANTLTNLPVAFSSNLWWRACGTVGTKCYLFGGRSSSPSNVIEMFDTETNTLTTLSVTLPNAANAIACGVVGKNIYLFGGLQSSALRTINVFNTETNTITTLSAQLPSYSYGIACAVVGTKCYLFGGAYYSMLNTISVFDTATNTITTLSTTLPKAANGIGCCAVEDKIYLFGGNSDNGMLDTINVFDTATNTITTLSAKLPAAHDGISCGVVGTIPYLFGGGSNEIKKFVLTFPLNEDDVFIQENLTKNKFTLVTAPTEVKTGVSAVYVGNAQNEAEYAEARLYNSTSQTWKLIT